MACIVMKSRTLLPVSLLLVLALAPAASAGDAAGDHSAADPGPTVAEQVAGLEAMCAANSEAMATRQSEKSLYERIGGEEKIHEIVTEVVRLHGQNEQIAHLLDGVDQSHLIEMVTQFLVVATGGGGEYTGKGMVEAHDHLKLTNADFLAAGGDVIQSMKTAGCGEDEIQEVVCAFVGLRKAVVIESERNVQ